MNFTVTVNGIESREEFVALFDAIAAATPDDEQREAELFNAFAECADRLLKGLTHEEAERVFASLAVSLHEIAARREKQAKEDRWLARRGRP